MKSKKIKIDYPIFKVVGDGIMAAPSIGEGRFIPSLIIDVGTNQEITELIALHSETEPGDAEMAWGRPASFFKPKAVYLNFYFIKPMQVKFAIEFNFEKNYPLIDGIAKSKAIYLQTGKVGDKVSEFKNKHILIEIPILDFSIEWEKILFDTVKEVYRKKGVSKAEANNYAKEHISKMREIWNLRSQST